MSSNLDAGWSVMNLIEEERGWPKPISSRRAVIGNVQMVQDGYSCLRYLPHCEGRPSTPCVPGQANHNGTYLKGIQSIVEKFPILDKIRGVDST